MRWHHVMALTLLIFCSNLCVYDENVHAHTARTKPKGSFNVPCDSTFLMKSWVTTVELLQHCPPGGVGGS